MKASNPFTVMAIIMSLAACVGGGGGSGNPTLVSPHPPAPTPVPFTTDTTTAANVKAAAQNSRYDSANVYFMQATREYVNGNSRFTRVRCPSGTGLPATCVYIGGPPLSIEYVSLSASAQSDAKLAELGLKRDQLSNLELTSTTIDTSYTKPETDITLIASSGQNAGGETARRFGAWMDHSGFYLQTATSTGPPDSTTIRAFAAGDRSFVFGPAFSDGDRSGYIPRSDATYKGLMVGTSTADTDGIASGDRLAGDAVLLLSMNLDSLERTPGYFVDDPRIDVTFSNIRNIDTDTDLDDLVISFNNVMVSTSGQGFVRNAFNNPGSNNYIFGNFYGADENSQNEVAGAFRKDSIVGAFGARKQ